MHEYGPIEELRAIVAAVGERTSPPWWRTSLFTLTFFNRREAWKAAVLAEYPAAFAASVRPRCATSSEPTVRMGQKYAGRGKRRVRVIPAVSPAGRRHQVVHAFAQI